MGSFILIRMMTFLALTIIEVISNTLPIWWLQLLLKFFIILNNWVWNDQFDSSKRIIFVHDFHVESIFHFGIVHGLIFLWLHCRLGLINLSHCLVFSYKRFVIYQFVLLRLLIFNFISAIGTVPYLGRVDLRDLG